MFLFIFWFQLFTLMITHNLEPVIKKLSLAHKSCLVSKQLTQLTDVKQYRHYKIINIRYLLYIFLKLEIWNDFDCYENF